MAKKPKVTAKKSKKPTSGNNVAARAKAPKRVASRGAAAPAPTGAAQGGAGRRPANQFGTFEEAKSAALDNLIQSIEDAERRLTEAKRAHSYLELHRLTQGPAI